MAWCIWCRWRADAAQGHLLGATHKAKYADAGVPPAMAPAAGTSGGSLVYPIVEMREVDGVQMVRLKQARGVGAARACSRVRRSRR